MVVRKSKLSFIPGQRRARRIKFRAFLERLLQSRGCIDGSQLPFWCWFLGQLKIERLGKRVLVGANRQPKFVFGLFQDVFALDYLHAPRRHLRLRAVDIQRGQRP